MKLPPSLHRWTRSPRRARALQQELAPRVRIGPPRREFRLVAGVDCAFSPDGTRCLAAVVVWDLESEAPVEERLGSHRALLPYVPGLLSFREIPAILSALRRLRHEPDVFLCDGQGIAHPRRFGLACHLGVVTDRASVGCAKSRLTGEGREPGRRRGNRAPLLEDGERIGTVLRTRDGVKPLYVSVGHDLDLSTAEALVLRCGGGFRLPEPTRRADQRVAEEKRRRYSPRGPVRIATP